MQRFGVEIEFIGDLASVLAALRETSLVVVDSRHTHNTGNAPSGWAVKRDGSVQGGGELVSPPLNFDDPDQRGQVNIAVDALLRAGATTHQSAGIHVHIEAKNDDGKKPTTKVPGSLLDSDCSHADSKPYPGRYSNRVCQDCGALFTRKPTTKKEKRKARKQQQAAKQNASGTLVQVRGEWIPKEQWEEELLRAEAEQRFVNADIDDLLEGSVTLRRDPDTGLMVPEDFDPGVAYGD